MRFLIIATVTMLAAGGALAQNSSLYKRAEQGQAGSNRPAAPAAAAPSQSTEAAEASDADGQAPQASDTVNPAAITPVAAVPAGPSQSMSAVVDGRDRYTSPSVAALQAASFTSSPPPKPREFKVHDLVTIIVREETTYSSDGETELEKEYDLNAKLEKWIKFRLGNLQIAPTDMDMGTPEIKGSASRNFEGEGEVSRKDQFIGRITGEIIDVKPNGTLVIAARKNIKTDDEEQQFEVSGTARADDVTADNTVLSTQLADLSVRKVHSGAVRDSTKRGIVPRIIDWLNPF